MDERLPDEFGNFAKDTPHHNHSGLVSSESAALQRSLLQASIIHRKAAMGFARAEPGREGVQIRSF